MDRQHFLDLMGATNLIPGPNSTEMTMHCGHERAGWKGLFVAGIFFYLTCFSHYWDFSMAIFTLWRFTKFRAMDLRDKTCCTSNYCWGYF